METFNGIVFAFVVSAVLLLIVRKLPVKAREPSLKVGEVKLPIRLWYAAIPIFLVILLIDQPVARWMTRQWEEFWIEKADPNRISVIVPDFEGEGGVGAADTFRDMLQSDLGSGVQVIRVPALPASATYGNASKAASKMMVDSAFCAARYNGDIVVFGRNLPGSGQASVNFTIKEPDCFPSNCGLALARFPKLYPLADTGNPQSELAKSINKSAVVALTLATDRGEPQSRPAACLRDPAIARKFAAKADALVAGNPEGLSGELFVTAAGLGALFHGEAYKHTQDMTELDRGIATLDGAMRRSPGSTKLAAGLLAQLLVDRVRAKPDASLAQRFARRAGELVALADPRDRDAVIERHGALVEMAFTMAPTAAGLAEFEKLLQDQIATATTLVEELHGVIGIAAARRIFLLEAPDQPRHSATVEYARKAFEMIRTLPGGVASVPIADRCSLARTDMILTDFHLDLPSLESGLARNAFLINGMPLDWTLPDCVTAMHLMADNLGLQAERLGDAGTPQTVSALDIEHTIAANDKTEPPSVHRYFLAVAIARNAIASRLGEDRDEAIGAVNAAMREPDVMKDPQQARLLKRLDAKLRSLNVW